MDHVSVLKALRDEALARIEAAKRAIDEGLDGKMVASLDALISDLETPASQQILEPGLAPPQLVAEPVDVLPGNEAPPPLAEPLPSVPGTAEADSTVEISIEESPQTAEILWNGSPNPLAEPLPPAPGTEEVEPTAEILWNGSPNPLAESLPPAPGTEEVEPTALFSPVVAEASAQPVEIPVEESAPVVEIPAEESAPSPEIPFEESAPAAPEPPARPYTPPARSSFMAHSPTAELLVEEFDPDLPHDGYSQNIEQQQFAPDWLTGDDDTPVEIPIEDYAPSEISTQEPAVIAALPLETLPVMEVSQLEAILDPIPLDLPLVESPPAPPSRAAAPISELPPLLKSPAPSGTGSRDELPVLKLVLDERRE